MRRIIAADKPLVREVWDRARGAAILHRPWRDVQGRMGDGAARGRADHHVQDGSRRGGLDRPVPRSASSLDRQARPQRVQADARLGRLLARRPQEPDAEPNLRHGWLNKKQLDAYLVRLEEAAKRDHRKIGQEMDLFHLQAEAPGSVFWHPKGWVDVAPAGGLYAPQARCRRLSGDQDPAADRLKLWEQRPFGQVPREYVRRARRGAGDRGGQAGDHRAQAELWPEADELPGAHPGLQSGQPATRAAVADGGIRVPSSQRADGALHGIMRVRQFTQDDAHIFCTRGQVVERSNASAPRSMAHTAISVLPIIR